MHRSGLGIAQMQKIMEIKIKMLLLFFLLTDAKLWNRLAWWLVRQKRPFSDTILHLCISNVVPWRKKLLIIYDPKSKPLQKERKIEICKKEEVENHGYS